MRRHMGAEPEYGQYRRADVESKPGAYWYKTYGVVWIPNTSADGSICLRSGRWFIVYTETGQSAEEQNAPGYRRLRDALRIARQMEEG